MKTTTGLLASALSQLQVVLMALVIAVAAFLLIHAAGAAFGLFPWLEISAAVGGQQVENAGIWAEVGAAMLFSLLALYLPANRRILRLETSHRDFSLSMDDVVRAYRLSHEADRKRLFRIGSEFDAVRDRLAHLRSHPDLGALEPEVMELAAQMSYVSRDLASTYSEDKVARARGFLTQRQQEIEGLLETIALARKTTDDLRNWMLQLDTEEQIAERQIAALTADLMDLLPQLGFEVGDDDAPDPDRAEARATDRTPGRAPGDHTVVPLPHKADRRPGKTDA